VTKAKAKTLFNTNVGGCRVVEMLWKGGDLETSRCCWVTIGVRKKLRRSSVKTLSSEDLCDLWWRGVLETAACWLRVWMIEWIF